MGIFVSQSTVESSCDDVRARHHKRVTNHAGQCHGRRMNIQHLALARTVRCLGPFNRPRLDTSWDAGSRRPCATALRSHRRVANQRAPPPTCLASPPSSHFWVDPQPGAPTRTVVAGHTLASDVYNSRSSDAGGGALQHVQVMREVSAVRQSCVSRCTSP